MSKRNENSNGILLYQDENGVTSVSVRFANDDLWLTQNQIAEIYDTTQPNISQHIDGIFKDGELSAEATHKKFLLVQTEGARQVKREIGHYNLDVIIAVGYRVQSQIATRFRQWATKRLHEYIQKGFVMDDDRLKQGGGRYFRELLQRIRDIRSSERNFYQQVTDIYATSTDYDPRSDLTKMFFATVQNKMHFAVHEHTAAEIIHERVSCEKPLVGMTNFKGGYITKDDVKIAKNYLTEIELQRLNLLVSQFLDFAEFQALEQNPMTMKAWIAALDNQILSLKRKLLKGAGTISRAQAIEKAEKEFEAYRKQEMERLESDFDRAVKAMALPVRPTQKMKNAVLVLGIAVLFAGGCGGKETPRGDSGNLKTSAAVDSVVETSTVADSVAETSVVADSPNEETTDSTESDVKKNICTDFGEKGTFTDERDGQTYRTVVMPDCKTWMAENLNYQTVDSWCYDDKASNCDKYGRLYTWNVALKACPVGWRLSTDDDWWELLGAVGGHSTASIKLKSTTGWTSHTNIPAGTDNYAFSALPGGYRENDGRFNDVGNVGSWWTATEDDGGRAWIWHVNYSGEGVGRSYGDYSNGSEGNSVRCLHD